MTNPSLIAGNGKLNSLNRSFAAIDEMGRLCDRLGAPAEVVLFPPDALLAVSAILIKEPRLQLDSSDASADFAGDIAADILSIAEAGGLLVGGASLDAKQFSAICQQGQSTKAAAA